MPMAAATNPLPANPHESCVEHVIQNAVQFISRYLTSPWPWKYDPRGLDEALANLASTSDCKQRTFLVQGFQIWLVLFILKTRQSHYEGRQANVDTIEALYKLSIENIKLVAEKAASIELHPAVQEAIGKILRKGNRQQIVDSIKAQGSRRQSQNEPMSSPTLHPSTPSGESRQSAGVFDAPTDLSTHYAPSSFNATTEFNPATDLNLSTMNPSASENLDCYNYPSASLHGIEKTIPNVYMRGAIKRINVHGSIQAAVSMSFSGMWDDCDMTAEIKESSVAYIAMALFNAHIEVEFQTRHIMGAVIQTPNPTVTLCGIREQALIDLFGLEIFQAIDTSLLRWQEREEGIRATRCVRMEVSSDPHSSAPVKLKLELEQAIRIGTRLGFI